MILTITDQGDESVGIFSCSFEIQCPVEKWDDKDEIEGFRKMMIDAYSQFAIGKVVATFDYEMEELEKQFSGLSEVEEETSFGDLPPGNYEYPIL